MVLKSFYMVLEKGNMLPIESFRSITVINSLAETLRLFIQKQNGFMRHRATYSNFRFHSTVLFQDCTDS